MASKDELRAKLNEKHSGTLKKISPKALELILDKFVAKNPDQPIDELYEAIENSPLSLEDMILTMKSEADRRVKEATTAKPEPKKADDDNPEPQSGQPDLAKLIQQGIEAAVAPLVAKINGYEANDAKGKLTAKLKEAGVPEMMANYVSFGDGYKEDEVFDRLKTDWGEMSKTAVTSQLPGVPAARGINNPNDASKVSSDVSEYIKSKQPAPNAIN